MKTVRKRTVEMPLTHEVDLEGISRLMGIQVNLFRRDNGLTAVPAFVADRPSDDDAEAVRIRGRINRETVRKYYSMGEFSSSFEECVMYDAVERLCDMELEELLVSDGLDHVTVLSEVFPDACGRVSEYSVTLRLYGEV